MRINGQHGFQAHELQRDLAKANKPDAKEAGKARAAEATDSSVAKEVNPFVQQVLAMEDVRPSAVEAAKAALAGGELDTPEAAVRAARAILDGGI